MRVLAILGDYMGALCLQEILDQGDEVVAVVTYPTDPLPGSPPDSSVRLLSERNRLPLLQPPLGYVNTPHYLALFRDLKPDLIVSMNYPVVFGQGLLSIPCLGCINEHPSRLPAGRGMTPSWWHMLTGGDRAWITLHYLDASIDTGDIIAQGSVPITSDDDGHTVDRRVAEEGRRILAASLPLIRCGAAPRLRQAQSDVSPSYYSWRPYMARLRWRRPAAQIALLVRCLAHPKGEPSWTGTAYTRLAGRKVLVWAAEPAEIRGLGTRSASSGEVVVVAGRGPLVATGQGYVLLTDFCLEGSPRQGMDDLADHLRGGRPVVFS